MDVKTAMVALNLAAMSNFEVIADLAVARRPVVIQLKLTMYVKERHEQGRNYVVDLCLIIGGPETGWGACAHWGRFPSVSGYSCNNNTSILIHLSGHKQCSDV